MLLIRIVAGDEKLSRPRSRTDVYISAKQCFSAWRQCAGNRSNRAGATAGDFLDIQHHISPVFDGQGELVTPSVEDTEVDRCHLDVKPRRSIPIHAPAKVHVRCDRQPECNRPERGRTDRRMAGRHQPAFRTHPLLLLSGFLDQAFSVPERTTDARQKCRRIGSSREDAPVTEEGSKDPENGND